MPDSPVYRFSGSFHMFIIVENFYPRGRSDATNLIANPLVIKWPHVAIYIQANYVGHTGFDHGCYTYISHHALGSWWTL